METQIKRCDDAPVIPEMYPSQYATLIRFVEDRIFHSIDRRWSSKYEMSESHCETQVGDYRFSVTLTKAKTVVEHDDEPEAPMEECYFRMYRILLLNNIGYGRVVAMGADIDAKSAIRSLLMDPNVRRWVRHWKQSEEV